MLVGGIDLRGRAAAIFSSVWFGYLVMLVAMTFVFVGVKRYRDIETGRGDRLRCRRSAWGSPSPWSR